MRLPIRARHTAHVLSPCHARHHFRARQLLRRCNAQLFERQAVAADFGPPKEGTFKKEAQLDLQEVQDKLIAAFQSKPQGSWRKMMGFSKQWPKLADGVFERVRTLIQDEKDAETKLRLRRFLRSLQTAHTEVAAYAAAFARFEAAKPQEFDSVVAGHMDALTPGFFEYMQHIIAAAQDDRERQEALLALATRIAALVSAFEKAAADEDALDSAAEKFNSLLMVDSMEDAEKKLDEMAASGQLDPALLLTMAKAYNSVKETDYTREEVKDLMYHLYLKGKEAAAREAPAEVRILKHLLTMDDPLERNAELENALQPGGELETPNKDYLSTDPHKLMATVDTVLAAFDASRSKGTMLGQTADLMNPAVISRMREIQTVLRSRFM